MASLSIFSVQTCAKEVEARRASEAIHLAEITQATKDQTIEIEQHKTTYSDVQPDTHVDVDFDMMFHDFP